MKTILWGGYSRSYASTHPQVQIWVVDRWVWVDELMAPLLARMNELGIVTHYSCQGRPGLVTPRVIWWSGAYILMPETSALVLAKFKDYESEAHRSWLQIEDWVIPSPRDPKEEPRVNLMFPQEAIGEMLSWFV